MTNATVEHFYRGKLFENGSPRSDFMITACSRGLTKEECQAIFDKHWYLNNPNVSYEQLDEGYALLDHDESNYLLTYVAKGSYLERGYPYAAYHCWLIPRTLLSSDYRGNLSTLVYITETPPKVYELSKPDYSLKSCTITLTPLTYPDEIGSLNWIMGMQVSFRENGAQTSDEENAPDGFGGLLILSILLGDEFGGSQPLVFAPPNRMRAVADVQVRLSFAQSISILLPSSLRYELSFATNVFDAANSTALLKFTDSLDVPRGAEDRVVYWGRKISIPSSMPDDVHPYIVYLRQYWSGAEAIFNAIENIDSYLRQFHFDEQLSISEKLRVAMSAFMLDNESLRSTVSAQNLARVLIANTGNNNLVQLSSRMLADRIEHDTEHDILREIIENRERFAARFQPIFSTILKQYVFIYEASLDELDAGNFDGRGIFTILRKLADKLASVTNPRRNVSLEIEELFSVLTQGVLNGQISSDLGLILKITRVLATRTSVALAYTFVLLLLSEDRVIQNDLEIFYSDTTTLEQLLAYFEGTSRRRKAHYELEDTLRLTLKYIFWQPKSKVANPVYENDQGVPTVGKETQQKLTPADCEILFSTVDTLITPHIEVGRIPDNVFSQIIFVKLLLRVIQKSKGKERANFTKCLLSQDSLSVLISNEKEHVYCTEAIEHIIGVIGYDAVLEHAEPKVQKLVRRRQGGNA